MTDLFLVTLHKYAAEKLRGGAADGVPDADVPARPLAEGVQHESEHTDDPEVAKEIAKDHLVEEGSDYYEKLETLEKDADIAQTLVATGVGLNRPAPAIEALQPRRKRRRSLAEMSTALEDEQRRPFKFAALREDVPPAQAHQERARRRLNTTNPRLLVYAGLGTGKTRSAIMAAEDSGEPYTAVVPASLKPNFEGEIQRWTDGRTPHEVLTQTGVALGKRPTTPPATVVVDEAHRLRNPGSAAARGVEDVAAQAKRLVLLTGTPIVNEPSDLAEPITLLTGKRMTPRDFDRRFVDEDPVRPWLWQRAMGATPGVEPRIKDRRGLERLLRGKVDYTPGRAPEGVTVDDERVPVELSPSQADFHRLMWGKLPFWTRWKLQNQFPLSHDELRKLNSFLVGPRQAALSLLPYAADKDPWKAFEGSSKLVRAKRDLDTTLKNPRAKALVFSNFIDAGLKPYAAALERARVPYGMFHGAMSEAERKAMLADYNAGRRRVLLLGPAGAEGISAKGTQLIQLLDPHFNASRSDQARGRGLRFDSHQGLPEDLRGVKVRRYVATTPPPGWLARNLLGRTQTPSADEILERMAARKERLNDQFRQVLQDVGTEDA